MNIELKNKRFLTRYTGDSLGNPQYPINRPPRRVSSKAKFSPRANLKFTNLQRYKKREIPIKGYFSFMVTLQMINSISDL